VLRPVQNLFKGEDYPDLIVGLDDPDDAAVWRLDSNRALVITTDFFTPVVDDPFDYGQIAAANALSDIYAMGGNPFLALNIAALPPFLPPEVTGEIIRGGAEKSLEAGVVVAGGHTIQDNEPKYGLVVVGFVHPKKKLTKAGLQIGDHLFLTKPIGFGVTTTALKQEKADPEDVNEVVTWMKRLNKAAAGLAGEFNLKAATDITGFSLIGHGLEMAQASGVSLEISLAKIPFVSCAHKYAEMWTFPGGASDNRQFFGPQVEFMEEISDEDRMLLFDPQTSGGLLLGVPENISLEFQDRAKELKTDVWSIGKVIAGEGIKIIE
jgi:selenide,water dikinase